VYVLFLLQNIQTGFVANPPFYSLDTGVLFQGGEAVWAWSWPLISIYCQG